MTRLAYMPSGCREQLPLDLDSKLHDGIQLQGASRHAPNSPIHYLYVASASDRRIPPTVTATFPFWPASRDSLARFRWCNGPSVLTLLEPSPTICVFLWTDLRQYVSGVFPRNHLSDSHRVARCVRRLHCYRHCGALRTLFRSVERFASTGTARGVKSGYTPVILFEQKAVY